MALAQRRAGNETGPAKRSRRSLDQVGFDWIFMLLCSWLIGGIFLDGWAHNHGKVDQSFFTPYHGLLYAGYVAVSSFLVIRLVRTHMQGVPWRHAIPAGYGASVIGAAIFAVGAVGDLAWHTAFGIEKGIEGNISPSHLTLAIGGALIITGPLRALWQRTAPYARPGWASWFPTLLSLTAFFSLLTFFTQYAHPIVKSRADLQITQILITLTPFQTATETDLSTKLGVTSVLLQAAITMGVILLAVRRWQVPFGSFALFFGLNGLLMGVLAEDTPVLAVGLLSALIGLMIDLLHLMLQPSAQRVLAWRVFAGVAPVVNYLVYFAVLFVLKGHLGWSVHLWTGAIVEAGLVGLLLSYLLIPPQLGTRPPTTEA